MSVDKAEPQAAPGSGGGSYKSILNSTSVFGGLGVLTILLGIVRNKVAAVYIGPVGMGTLGLYNSLVSTIAVVVGLGLPQSGIRQIAAASGAGDSAGTTRSIGALRRATFLLAILGFVGVLALCRPLSFLTFKNFDHAWAIAALAICVSWQVLAAAEAGVLQGLRKIRSMALGSSVGGAAGTILTIVLLKTLGGSGILYSAIGAFGLSAAMLVWQGRRAANNPAVEPWAASLRDARGMAATGLAMMASGIMTAVVGSLSMAYISQALGAVSVGQFQAAWVLSSVYVGFILNAMATDYYPRLAEKAADQPGLRRLVNEQLQVGVMLVTPGILLALLWNESLLKLFYSPEFQPAAAILHWQVLGMFLRIISWPMGYILPALGKVRLYLCVEIGSHGLTLLLLWLCTRRFGIAGIGMSFFFVYVVYSLIVYLVTRSVGHFSFDPKSIREMVMSSIVVAAIALAGAKFQGPWFLAAGTLIAGFVGALNLVKLYRLAPDFKLFRWFTKRKA